MRRALTVLSLIVLFLPVPSLAATYYVAKTGNNAYSCTQARSQSTPKRTIRAGVNCARAAGDTVVVKAGTYTESVSMGASGTSGKPITLKANPGDTVIWKNSITDPASWTAALNIGNQSYIRIEGFTFRGSRTRTGAMQIHNYTNDKANSLMQGIEIVNNTFDNNGQDGGGSGLSSHVIYLYGVGRNAAYTGGTVNTIRGNTFTNNYGYHISLVGTSDFLIANNTGTGAKGSKTLDNGDLYSAAHVYMVSIPENGVWSERHLIENNTFGGFNGSRNSMVELSGVRCDVQGRKSIIRNNTIHNILYGAIWNDTMHVYGIMLEAGCDNNTVKNNIIYQTAMACIAVAPTEANTVAVGNVIDGNVGYRCDKVGLFLDNAKNTTVKNNIFMDNGARGGSQVQVNRASVSNGGHAFHNNDYWTAAGPYIGVWNHNWWDAYVSFPTANLTLSQWTGASGDTNSLSVDPLCVSPPSNFHLQAGSPTRGAGENGIDMGAYPAAASTSLLAPTNLRTVP